MSLPSSSDVVIVGGGIAGLATAWQLAGRGWRPLVLEREPALATHASGRNAAIFRQLDGSLGGTALALRSGLLLDELCGGREGWCKTTGALYVARTVARLAPLLAEAQAHGVSVELISQARALTLHPLIEGDAATHALHVAHDGVIDNWGVLRALRAAASAAGATIVCGSEVTGVGLDGARVVAVEVGAHRIATPQVVNAAGAWAGQLASLAGCATALRPLRRHLVQLRGIAADPAWPVAWCLDEAELYMRVESGGLLLSPCDETLCDPDALRPDDGILDEVARRGFCVAPELQNARPASWWPCVRTFALDRNIVMGCDPRRPGYAILAGLGGHGMSAGVAAGEHLAALLCGEPCPVPLDFTRALYPA